MNTTFRYKTSAFLRLITLFVLMSFSFASFSHAMHFDAKSQQVDTLDCKLCQHNLDDNNNELVVSEHSAGQFTVKLLLNKPYVQHFQFYVTPALRAPPIN